MTFEVLAATATAIAMKTDLYPHFIIENRIRSEIVENENRSKINGITKTNGKRNIDGNS
jgi:hypothetical protein